VRRGGLPKGGPLFFSRGRKGFFLKKEAKTFVPGPGRATQFASPWRGTMSKSFLVLFFKKEPLAFCYAFA
jgi:hypothetical protein